MIKINHTLQILIIAGNPISDEGIEAIAKSLDNTRISDLNVLGCNITVTGGKALAAGLTNNHTIKLLNVKYNDITMDGIISILEAVVANRVCQEVIINDEYKSDDKVKEMMTILEERKRQEVGSIIT